MHSGLLQVPVRTGWLPGLREFEKGRKSVVLFDSSMALAFPFRIASNLTSRRMVLSRCVALFFHPDFIVDTIPVYSPPMFMRIAACNIMRAPFVPTSKSSVARLQKLSYASW